MTHSTEVFRHGFQTRLCYQQGVEAEFDELVSESFFMVGPKLRSQ